MHNGCQADEEGWHANRPVIQEIELNENDKSEQVCSCDYNSTISEGSPVSYIVKHEDSEGVSLDSRTSDLFSDNKIGKESPFSQDSPLKSQIDEDRSVSSPICNGIHTGSSTSFGSPARVDFTEDQQKSQIIEEIVQEILSKSEKLLEIQDEELASLNTEGNFELREDKVQIIEKSNDDGNRENAQEALLNAKNAKVSTINEEIINADVPLSPVKSIGNEKELIDSESERYLTPTEEMADKKDIEIENKENKQIDSKEDKVDEVKEIKDNSGDSEGNNVTVPVTLNEEGQGDVSDKHNVSDSELATNKSNFVPIVENSAVSVEIEPSNQTNSSLDEINISVSDKVDSKSNVECEEGTPVEKEQVPTVEKIPTISQYCDPSYSTTTTNTATDVVVDNVSPKRNVVTSERTDLPPPEARRRVSLPTNHIESQTDDHTSNSHVPQASPQRRPRSASISTQVDSNQFGKFFSILYLYIKALYYLPAQLFKYFSYFHFL